MIDSCLAPAKRAGTEPQLPLFGALAILAEFWLLLPDALEDFSNAPRLVA